MFNQPLVSSLQVAASQPSVPKKAFGAEDQMEVNLYDDVRQWEPMML
jgi:hypothetical protein